MFAFYESFPNLALIHFVHNAIIRAETNTKFRVQIV